MNLERILGFINKGIEAIRSLIEAGGEVSAAIDAIKAVTQKGSDITEEDIAEQEAKLDELLAELDSPLE